MKRLLSSCRDLTVVLAVALGVSSHVRAQPTQVYVQDSPAAVELLAAAQDRLSKDEPEEAARLVQQVFDQHGSKLMELRPGGYSEARRVASSMLLKNKTLLGVYRKLQEPVAARQVEQAGGDPLLAGQRRDCHDGHQYEDGR